MSLDPLVLQAQATAAAGNAIATFLLGKDGSAAVKGLTDLAAALPKIPVGGVQPYDLGVITAELQVIQTKVSSGTTELINQAASLVSLVSQGQSVAASNGIVTVNQAILVSAGQNVASGIGNAIAFWQGQQSVAAAASTATASK